MNINAELKIGGYEISIDQTPPFPAWVHLEIGNNKYSFYPDDYIMFVDFLNSSKKFIKNIDGEDYK